MDFNGRVVMVTGAAQGIGKATALMFSEYGADVVVADVNSDGVLQTLKEVEQRGRRGVAVAMNVSDKNQVETGVQKALEALGKIEILVNGAGICPSALLQELTEEAWDRVMSINAKGTFLCSQVVARNMIKNRYGKIINISSIASKTGEYGNGVYCVSKAAVSMLTQVQALELAEHNINVNAVCPGYTNTELLHRAFQTRASDGTVNPENYKQALIEKVPLRRMAEPEEIAELIAFLASEKAAYITGEAVLISGGKEMH